MNADDLIAEAARLARQTGVRRSPVGPTRVRQPDLTAIAKEAAAVASKQRARQAADIRAQKARESWQRRLAEQDQMFHRQAAAEVEMDNCHLRHDSVRGIPDYALGPKCWLEHRHTDACTLTRLCYLCGKALPKFARRWCSNACSTTWWRNHLWREANAAAQKRDDYTCRHCGVSKYVTLAGSKTLNVLQSTCRCGAPWEGDKMTGSCAVTADIGRRVGGHYPLITYVDLEVNHRDPLVGAGYANSCRHHLDGLETLCHPCHVKVTNQQRSERSEAALARRILQLGL